jgi:hypothetical protein
MIACRDLLQKPLQNHAPDFLGGPKAIAPRLFFLRYRINPVTGELRTVKMRKHYPPEVSAIKYISDGTFS